MTRHIQTIQHAVLGYTGVIGEFISAIYSTCMLLHSDKQIAVDRTVKFFDSFLNKREHGQQFLHTWL